MSDWGPQPQPAAPAAAPTRTRRRGGGAARGLLIFVLIGLIIGGLLFFGDRWARGEVEQRAGAQLQTELGTPTAPSVVIGGFPFLTQALSGRIGRVDVDAAGVGTTVDTGLVVDQLDLTLTDVTSTDRFATMTAADVQGRAEMQLSALRGITGLDLANAGGGRVSLQVSQQVFGATITATVTGRIALDAAAQTVSLADPTLQVGNVNIPDGTARLLIESVVKPVPVTGIPYGLQLTFLDLSDTGLTAGLAGRDVTFRR